MHEHLHPFVMAQVDGGLLIHRFRLIGLQVGGNHLQRLLVALHQLGLRGIGDTGDSWRQHVVHRLLIVVLLDVHGTHVQHTTLGATRVETVFVETPFAAHQIQTTEAEYDGLLETRHEHTHEPDAGKVADATLLASVIH